VLILDCCFSGAVKQAFAKGAITDVLHQQALASGLSILTSSTELQESFERPEDDQSLFTKMLVDGIMNGYADADNDGIITVDDAFTYAENAVRGTGMQQPTRLNLNVTGQCVLARNRNYKVAERPSITKVPAEFIGAYMAVEHVVNSVQQKAGLPYFVALNGYWIEGFPYSASGLSVDVDRTPNMRQLQDGFECDTWFETHMVHPATVKRKEILTRPIDDGRTVQLVKVRLNVRLEDIGMIAAFEDGRQIDLFVSVDAFGRKIAFFEMTNKFFADRNRKTEP
jgi:hypothetical protein